MPNFQFTFLAAGRWSKGEWQITPHSEDTLYLVVSPDATQAGALLENYYGHLVYMGQKRPTQPLDEVGSERDLQPFVRALDYAGRYLGSIQVENAIFAIDNSQLVYTIVITEGTRARVITGKETIAAPTARNGEFSVDLGLRLLRQIQNGIAK